MFVLKSKINFLSEAFSGTKSLLSEYLTKAKLSGKYGLLWYFIKITLDIEFMVQTYQSVLPSCLVKKNWGR